MDCKPEIALTSNFDGTYTLVIGSKSYKNVSLDEALAVISGEEMEDAKAD